MVNRYTYSMMGKGNYYCSKKDTKKCKSKVKLDANEAVFIPTKRGNLLMVNRYTYSMMGKGNYYCSKKQTLKCKAKVKLDENNCIIDLQETHTHHPPNMHRTKEGIYISI
ncbi:uncharacterized protein LOC134679584 [Cydia fagiglandana]|uniref:uncharacterized protein LOC134679584 n=1 Tax=Cydia fagiglandana TaxID=1458189 RepID=UPI002FEDEEF7